MSIKKKILVAFDGSHYSGPVLDFAISLCKGNGNQLTGLFIEDLSYIYMLTNIGTEPQTFEYPTALLDDIEKEDLKAIDQNITLFKNKCAEAGINFNAHLDKGVPAAELVKESAFADILLIGYQTYFSNLNQASSETVQDFLKGSHCPVWVVPQVANDIHEIIFAYDGHESSVWAIKQFILLFGDNYKHKKATLLRIINNPGEDLGNEPLILDYLRLNFPAIEHEVRVGKPEVEIPQFAENMPGSLLIMGSYGRGFISRLFKKSAAEKVIESGSVPVFIAHR